METKLYVRTWFKDGMKAIGVIDDNNWVHFALGYHMDSNITSINDEWVADHLYVDDPITGETIDGTLDMTDSVTPEDFHRLIELTKIIARYHIVDNLQD